MNCRRVTTLVLYFLVAHYSLSLCQINYYSSENIYRFAEYLFQNRDYLRAAGEYQRYVFSLDVPDYSDSLLYKIGSCYHLGSESEKSIRYYESIILNFPQSCFYDRAHYQIAYIYFKKEKYNESINYIGNNIHNVSSFEGLLKINHLLGINYLYQRQWETAACHFSSLFHNRNHIFDDSLTAILYNYAVEGTRLHYKSKIAAGLMSSIVPGTGKMYGRSFNDGFYSLFLVSITAWQAYDGFSRNDARSVKGWIYGTFCTVFYLGNIYGSIVNVTIYNERLEKEYFDKITINLTWK